MKEIGKLIELLNEYDPYIMGNGEKGDNFWFIVSRGGSAIFLKENGIQMIISKSYGFIEWLVENDKIDRSKFRKYSTGNTQGEREIQKIYYYGRISSNKLNYTEGYSEVDELLMLLSISDTPIEDLISYLK